MEVPNTLRIVILGKTGAGKSSLANTIFGEDGCEVDDSPNSGTKECQAQTKSVNGRNITLIDTPGFFDTDTSEEEMKPAIVRCITECVPGPHAFFIVLKVEKFTVHENDVITQICEYFSEDALKYAAVVFTHGDQLRKGETISDFVHKNKSLSDLVKKCGNRCHVIDNKYWSESPKDEYRNNQFQVQELLKTIESTMLANKGKCYTNEMLQIVYEAIKQEEERIRKSSGNMSEEEIRQQAKDRVFKKLLIRLGYTVAGALLGAFLGVTGPLSLVTGALLLVTGALSWVAGAVAGGVIGYNAAEEADKQGEHQRGQQGLSRINFSGSKSCFGEAAHSRSQQNQNL